MTFFPPHQDHQEYWGEEEKRKLSKLAVFALPGFSLSLFPVQDFLSLAFAEYSDTPPLFSPYTGLVCQSRKVSLFACVGTPSLPLVILTTPRVIP